MTDHVIGDIPNHVIRVNLMLNALWNDLITMIGSLHVVKVRENTERKIGRGGVTEARGLERTRGPSTLSLRGETEMIGGGTGTETMGEVERGTRETIEENGSVSKEKDAVHKVGQEKEDGARTVPKEQGGRKAPTGGMVAGGRAQGTQARRRHRR
uniref:Uncharacterized protein n=1 Tax=Palpitomonas bilix TaxID=652834 RepID=A0A7S3DHR0_9EUKA|mmetsp:Transcript_3615/g.6948  ORF Transcript_3615/g.6948 Transcript_3615/m.6948 type:complete len:155 (+) Transcript_3615:126-590(+)